MIALLRNATLLRKKPPKVSSLLLSFIFLSFYGRYSIIVELLECLSNDSNNIIN